MASFGVFGSFFYHLKQVKNEGELGIVHGKARLKLNYMKNPSFGELRSLCQINQVCKEENQKMNLTFNNFATPCETENEFRNPLRNFRNLAKSSCNL